MKKKLKATFKTHKKVTRPPQEVHLGNEVAALANHVVAAIRHSVSSPEAKALGREAMGAMRTTGNRLAQALRQAQQSETTQDPKHQAQRLLKIGQQRTKGNTKNLRRNLAKGFDKVGQELQRLAKSLDKK